MTQYLDVKVKRAEQHLLEALYGHISGLGKFESDTLMEEDPDTMQRRAGTRKVCLSALLQALLPACPQPCCLPATSPPTCLALALLLSAPSPAACLPQTPLPVCPKPSCLSAPSPAACLPQALLPVCPKPPCPEAYGCVQPPVATFSTASFFLFCPRAPHVVRAAACTGPGRLGGCCWGGEGSAGAQCGG